MPYIPFNSVHTGTGKSKSGEKSVLWRKMFHYFQFNREEFMGFYHKRSNVESVFSMVKAKFGGNVRSKTEIAMKNEVFCKFLAHNICVLITAMHELGIDISFKGINHQ